MNSAFSNASSWLGHHSHHCSTVLPSLRRRWLGSAIREPAAFIWVWVICERVRSQGNASNEHLAFCVGGVQVLTQEHGFNEVTHITDTTYKAEGLLLHRVGAGAGERGARCGCEVRGAYNNMRGGLPRPWPVLAHARALPLNKYSSLSHEAGQTNFVPQKFILFHS